MKIQLTSGTMEEMVDIPDENVIGVLSPAAPLPILKSNTDLIRDAIETPIDSSRLEQLIHPHSTIAIVVDDHTRPTPTKDMLKIVLQKLADLGVQDERITITVGNGLHKKPPLEEQMKMFGQEIFTKYDIKVHEARDETALAYIGATHAGTPFWVNKRVAEADLVISLGMIKSHAFAGFTGGAKSILPGVSGKETILKNHRYEFIDYPNGILGDAEMSAPRKDMEDAASKLPVFIVNVVLDLKKRVVGAFAGNLVGAHRKGVELFRKFAEVQVHEQADVVIVEGEYPASENLYFALFGAECVVMTKSPIVKRGGTIILPTQCREGVGGKIIEEVFATFSSPGQVLEHLKHSPPVEEQWAAQHLAYCLLERDIAIVTNGTTKENIEKLKMRYFNTVQEALYHAFEKYGRKMKIFIIKNAAFLIANVC
jgi:nickel-dependent lactate racemase